MRGLGIAGLLLLPAALVAVVVTDLLWPPLRRAGAVVAQWTPLVRLQGRVGRLPAALALPLFLIPEACSRLGWVASAWLILQGRPWQALELYVASKVVAGSLALWICSACMPVLLRLRWFAAVHGWTMQLHGAAARWMRARSGGRFRAVMVRVRAECLGTLPGR